MGNRLAQFNIGRLRSSLDPLRVRKFTAAMTEINRMAESSPGFVWRLPDHEAHLAVKRSAPGPIYIVNLSLWKDYESLHAFVYRSPHGYFTKHRRRWFDRVEGPAFVLWWVREGHLPDLQEGRSRLGLLRRYGPGPRAFSVPTSVRPHRDATP
jgi:hypothetical protein